MPSENNKRLAKNTLFMYFRMGITILVSLYAARIVINTLGIEDYGLYNVVGGVVILFSFLNQSLSTATQRYLSVELGKNNYPRLQEIFSTSFVIYTIVVFVVLILAETIGLWFLNSKMNFPENRIIAANWVYQFSILSACVNIIRAPFNANVIATEKMSFYAYTSIIEAVLKLVILFILVIQPFDKLIMYAILMFSIVLGVTLWYYVYNKTHFTYIILIPKVKNIKLFKELVSFSGWGIFGSIANVGFRQGINVLINLFFGVSVNAAFGIANSVSSLVNQFVGGFQVSLNPQLTKSQASKDIANRDILIYRSSKFSFFLLLLIGIPILFNTNYLLTLWLKTTPLYATKFCQLMIIGAMIDAISAPFWVVIFATGKIRLYQIVVSLVVLSNILFSYIFIKIGYGPEVTLYIRITIFIIQNIIRLIFLKYLISFNIWQFCKKVIFPIIAITTLSIPLPYYLAISYNGFIRLILLSFLSIIFSCIFIFYIGMDKKEKEFMLKIINNFKNKILL